MGITSFFVGNIQKKTVENEFWIFEGSKYVSMMEAIGYDMSKEVFSVVLDNLELLPDEGTFFFIRRPDFKSLG